MHAPRTYPHTLLLLPLTLLALAGCQDQPLSPDGKPAFVVEDDGSPTTGGGGGGTSSQSVSSPIVTTTADPGNGTCEPSGTGDGCTLREAIAFADAGATITFDPALTAAGAATIQLDAVAGGLVIDKNLVLTGPASGYPITVRGNDVPSPTMGVSGPATAVTIGIGPLRVDAPEPSRLSVGSIR